jgi:hypothetical protein
MSGTAGSEFQDRSDWAGPDADAGQKAKGAGPNGGTDGDASTTLQLRYGFDAAAVRPLGTIVEGILHAGSITLIYGPPKSGKSFLVTDLSLSVAAQQDEWMGHVIVRPGPVLYVACEGHAGFWKRLNAAAKQRGWDGRDTFPAGFILATGRPMLIRADARSQTYAPDPSAIRAALDDAKAHGFTPVAIIIDTVFRAFGVGNVNASADMNVFLACIATLTDQGYAAPLVHHETKSGATPAGSVALTAGADTIVHVWRENEESGRHFWKVEMAKDDAETQPRAFTLEVVSLGRDADGRPATSCVVIDAGAAPDAAAPRKRGRPPSGTSEAAIFAGAVYQQICELLADPTEGQDIAFAPAAQPIRAIGRSRLRATLNQAGILDPVTDEADRQRVTKANEKRVNRALTRLKTQNKIALNDQWVGLPA